MKPQAALQIIALTTLWTAVYAQSGEVETERIQPRTTLPLLLLLGYPLALPQLDVAGSVGVGGDGILPGIPIRRPQDEPTITRMPPQVAADAPPQNAQNDASPDANAQIREQFIQGVLQGLQSMSANGGPGPTIQPAVLADLLQQVMAAQTTKPPPPTPPAAVEKEAQLPSHDDSSNDNDPDYDYIDFKNGSRIKYELDNNQHFADSRYSNKTLQQPTAAVVLPVYSYSWSLFCADRSSRIYFSDNRQRFVLTRPAFGLSP